MASVLLSRELQTHRVDGSGGDGGRDCYFSDDHGTDAYELKSFTGRMTQGRRRQVERSLARAMQRAPRSWTLIVPINATPAEQVWFDSLQAGVSARLDWKDRTWLEEKLAQYPDIIRFFSGAAEEVVRLLGEIAREDALPDDARTLGEQISGMVRRLNEVDPYCEFVYFVTGETTTVTAHPRYPDAFHDRPLQVSATLRFDDSPASQEIQSAFADFMTYGTRVVIPGAHIEGLVVDAPGGLGGPVVSWSSMAPSSQHPRRLRPSSYVSRRNHPSGIRSGCGLLSAAVGRPRARPAACGRRSETGWPRSGWNSTPARRRSPTARTADGVALMRSSRSRSSATPSGPARPSTRPGKERSPGSCRGSARRS
jgi:hypothetical protein